MLVNNAGLGDLASFVEMNRDAAEEMIAVNVLAVTRLTHAALPGMIARGGGTIINVSSGLAFNCMKGAVVYGATKAYVAHFTEILHEEVQDRGIRLQALIPGLTRTNLGGAEESGFFDRIPPEFVMSPQDVVNASLAGLELGELVCIPRLEDPGDWVRASAAIRAVTKSPASNKPAARYGVSDEPRTL
jgi:short-subunit dehydrogenase